MGAKLDDLTGQTFGEWTVLEYSGNKRWKCRCSCGTEKDVLGSVLRSGGSKSCGCLRKRFNDLTGQHIGEWEVLYRNDNRTYMCRCSCGTEKLVQTYHLMHGLSKSCGHDTNHLQDLTGQQFGELTAIKYVGERQWECRCSCGNIVNVNAVRLTNGSTKSCGCKSVKALQQTLIEKYGDPVPARSNSPREKWQIDVLSSKENLEAYIMNKKVTTNEDVTLYMLAEDLGVTHGAVLHRVEQFGIKDAVDLYSNTSRFEWFVVDIIKKCYDGEIVRQSRSIIKPYELDIYIPEKKVAFEINGNRWHSDLHKDKYYHQMKTLACAEQGIRLIHIFEYEIINNKDKITRLIRSVFNSDKDKIYARETVVENISNMEAQPFLNMYHLQGYVPASINLALKYNNEIVAIMSFGKPRFTDEYDYEVIRLCYKTNVIVVGGLEKLLKNFMKTHKGSSIITYCDISKFTGNGYLKAGFTIIKDNPISNPNYIWCNDASDVKSRYSTQKKQLVQSGLGKETETEDEILSRLGYYKIYNCGNLRLELINKN